VTERGANRYDLDRLAVIDDEVDVALRSLGDLEAEHAAGQLTDNRFTQLHAEYVARAADAVRRRQQEAAKRPVVPRRRRWVLIATMAGLALGAAAVGTSLQHGAHSRARGATITGDTQTVGTSASAFDAQAEHLLSTGDLTGALQAYLQAIRADSRDVEALSYAGWISFLGGAPDKARPLLDAAVRADPTYPDGHAFRGILLFRAAHDRAGAAAELRAYLRLVPSGEMSSQVRAVLAQIQGH
jgi:tetratricopeptide (TPR) repeat protein